MSSGKDLLDIDKLLNGIGVLFASIARGNLPSLEFTVTTLNTYYVIFFLRPGYNRRFF